MTPNCFGLAACVSVKSSRCCACPSGHACASLALVDLEIAAPDPSLDAERQRLSMVMQRFASAPPKCPTGQGTHAPKCSALKLAPRVASQVRSLSEKGWFTFAKQELAQGRNPGTKGWRRIFCQLLIERRCSRHTLEYALATELQMTPGSAKAQASTAVSVMGAGGIVIETEGAIRFTPN